MEHAGIQPQIQVQGFAEAVARIQESVGSFLPELVLCAAICAILLLDCFLARRRSRNLAFVAAGALLLAAWLVGSLNMREGDTPGLFEGMIASDSFTSFFKLLLLLGGTVCVAIAYLAWEGTSRRMGEVYALILAGVLGGVLMAAATDLVMIVLSLEILSISSYVLVGMTRGNRRSAEAGLKYVLFGAVASGVLLYGLSYFYGAVGTTRLADLQALLMDPQARSHISQTDGVCLLVAGILVFAGFAYKMAAFPMHFWAPDVYEGAPTPITAFLATISKAAGFAVTIRFFYPFAATALDSHGIAYLVPGVGDASGGTDRINVAMNWDWVLYISAAVSMLVGNLAALHQTNVKRLLAYSSISHAGFLLMGVSMMPDPFSIASVAFYLVVYFFTILGAFALAIIVERSTGTEDIEGWRGLGRTNPVIAASMTIFLLSLIGMPPTAGFAGKFQLFAVAVDHRVYWLAGWAAFNTVISVYYYARIIKAAFLENAEGRKVRVTPVGGVINAAMLVPTLTLIVFMEPIVRFAQNLVPTY